MNSIYDILKERELIKQIAFEEEFKELVKNEKISAYLGIDPTADSIHIGHFIPLMLMSYIQKCGHRPVILIGGGTAFVGDPSGKTDMRKMLSADDLEKNTKAIIKQVSRFVSFEGDNAAIIVNNADWLLSLKYLEFVRTYGVFFNVNKMLSADCYKQRLEKGGLTFFEMNYMLMQSYDFLHLYNTYNCKLELGGDDQWSNMIGGVELIRKVNEGSKKSFCLTCPLLLNKDGVKMGKTVNGALWLDKNRTSPYEFYQYFRNIDDKEVYDVLRMLTFIEMDEVKRLSNLEGSEINEAKKIAAFEITKIIHGEEEAIKAREAAESIFVSQTVSDNMPTAKLNGDLFNNNQLNIIDFLVETNIAPTRSESRRLIEQGGIVVDEEKILTDKHMLSKQSFDKGYVIAKKGKKVVIKVII